MFPPPAAGFLPRPGAGIPVGRNLHSPVAAKTLPVPARDGLSMSAIPAPPAEGEASPGTGSRRPRRIRTSRHRLLLALGAVAAAEIVGTVGLHLIEGTGWIDAFYFESMLATGQGPPFPLATGVGKVFASVMAFVSVGSTLTAVIFTLGPAVARLWRDAIEKLEDEARRLEHGAEAEVRRLRQEHR